jgi:glycosyltransferase involved in cell wall biosynthesis
MRVLQITPEFPPPLIGGGGYHVYNLTKELARKGVDITVFACNVLDSFFQQKVTVETRFENVKVYRVPAFYVPKTAYPISPSLAALLLKEKPDVMHAHGYQFFTSDIASIVNKTKKKSLILTLHGFPRSFNGLSHKMYFHLIGKQTLKAARKIIAVSKSVAHEFQGIGVPEKKITVIPNGVNLRQFEEMPDGTSFRERVGIEKNEKMMLSIGRLEETKGFHHLILALARTHAKSEPVKLVIAGPEFNYGQYLRRLVAKLNLKDSVVFYGPINTREKLEALAAADVAVVSSLYEGFSIFLLEAMAAGKPVISTRTGIAQELIKNGKNGFLVSIGDINGLSDRILEVLDNVSPSSTMSQESRRSASAFDWERIAEETISVYKQSLK